MRALSLAVLGLASGTLLSACADRNAPTAPPAGAATGPSFAVSGQAACPLAPNVVVTNEATLVAALGAASPGQVIGVSGTIVLHSDLFITTPNVTLTCAAPGAGIAAAAAATFSASAVTFLVNARANGVTVAYLALDAHNLAEGPYDGGDASGLRFTNNKVTCGADVCAFFDENTPNAVVTDNQFVSNGTCTGVHLQLGIDGSRIERNTVVANAPSTCPNLGGIRARDGSGVTIAHNSVLGPWSNSLALVNLASSRVVQNRSQGAPSDGIRARGLPPTAMTGNLFQGNLVTGAGEAGIDLRAGCGNTFLGNDLQGNAGGVGAIFDVMTGANTLVGNGTIVIDNGAFDCDGDGVNDPNIVTGAGAVTHGVNVGEVVSGALRTIHGIVLQ